MRSYREYIICKSIAHYMRLKYPNVLFHYDLAGLNLSKPQAGMMKAIQHSKGFPDLAILEPRNGHHGFFIEIKQEGVKLYKKNDDPATPHIAEQLNCLLELRRRGYLTAFGVGFDHIRILIDDYLNNKL